MGCVKKCNTMPRCNFHVNYFKSSLPGCQTLGTNADNSSFFSEGDHKYELTLFGRSDDTLKSHNSNFE